MEGSPFHDQTQSPWRQTTLQYREIPNVYDNLMPPLPGVKMGWGMILIKHGDNNAIETSNLRHPTPFLNYALMEMYW
jgi:hypothetical protein